MEVKTQAAAQMCRRLDYRVIAHTLREDSGAYLRTILRI